jgi:hypothetical protein
LPSYTYLCDECGLKTEVFFTLKDYEETIECSCGADMRRSYQDDLMNMGSSVIKSDSELKTIGDLADRNRDRMSSDHKAALNRKHNEYKNNKENQQKSLPQGMSRLKKTSGKFQWPK